MFFLKCLCALMLADKYSDGEDGESNHHSGRGEKLENNK